MSPTVHVNVDPGICGFCCRIKAVRKTKQVVRVQILASDCEHVRKLDMEIGEVGLRDLFLPLRRNPVIIAAEKAGCHAACPVPTAVIKAVEAALGLALAKPVVINICTEEKTDQDQKAGKFHEQ